LSLNQLLFALSYRSWVGNHRQKCDTANNFLYIYINTPQGKYAT
jgi:hypothetical protein